MSIKELRHSLNMTQRQFAEYYSLPLGTLRNWEQDLSSPPDYVIDMIIASARRDKMINIETIRFIRMLDELAELSSNGIDEFSRATQINFGSMIFYDTTQGEDGRYPIVLDACIIDDPECYHHDASSYYGCDSTEFSVNVVIGEAGNPYILVNLYQSKEEIIIENGSWSL